MGISSSLGSSALLPAGLGFRNLIINGDFGINQRGFSSNSGNIYGFDRWTTLVNTGTVTHSSQSFSLGNAIPEQEPKNYARLVTSGQSASNAYAFFVQKIESVRTLAGKTATISFWARTSSGTPKISVEFEQVFGTGGSPSSVVATYCGQVTVSTSWTRYSLTIKVPSISGKTVGTTDDGSINLNIWVSGGSDFNSRTGSIGIQNSTFDIWGVQVEQNYQPTPFEQRPIGVELALCQRYYEKSYADATAPGTSTFTRLVTMTGSAGSATTGEIIGNYYWAAVKRVAPTVAWYDHSGNSNRVTRLQYGVANHANNVASAGTVTERMAVVSSLSGNTGQSLQFHFVADVEL